MARYWPSSFLRFYGPRPSWSIKSPKKKERGQYPAILTEQAWSIKDLKYGFRGNLSCKTWLVVLPFYGPRPPWSINSQIKERGQYPAILTEQACSIKNLKYGFRGNLSCKIRRVVPSGQDSSILPARLANLHLARSRS